MEKKLWSADSRSYLYMMLLFAIPALFFGVGLLFNYSAASLLNTLLYSVILFLTSMLYMSAKNLEELVNFELKEFGYTHVLQGVVPEVVDKQFLGFAVDGLNYPKLTVEAGYYVEETKHPKTPVTMYEYQFMDPKNNILVVFNETEPPTKGGVAVFVK